MNNNIVKLRKDRGWTQDELAEKLGISKNYVSLIENGRKIPADRLVADICRLFDVNEEWLRTGRGNPKRETSDDFGEILGEITKNDPKAKEAILRYAELSPADRELFWNFVERFIKPKAED